MIVGSTFVKPSRSQEDFLKWLWRQFRSKDLTSLSARQIWGRVITLEPLHTRWQWSPQLLCKCNVTLTDKQIIREWRGGAGRRDPKRKKKSPQLGEIRGVGGRSLFNELRGRAVSEKRWLILQRWYRSKRYNLGILVQTLDDEAVFLLVVWQTRGSGDCFFLPFSFPSLVIID